MTTMITRRAVLVSSLLAAGSTLLPRPAPADEGTYSPNYALPNIAIHAAIVPNTTWVVMGASRSGSPTPGTHAWAWDWNAPTAPAVDMSFPWDYDFMCGGNTLLHDGRFFVAGGRLNNYQSAILTPTPGGSPRTWTWTPGPEFCGPIAGGGTKCVNLYYPSAATDGAGRAYVFLGVYPYTWVWDTPSQTVLDEQAFRLLPGKSPIIPAITGMSYYPRVFVQPDGAWVNAGSPQQMARRLTVQTGAWTDIAPMSLTRFEGLAFPKPGTDGTTIIACGGDTGLTRNTVESIDLRETPARWITAPAKLHFNHQAANVVLLPDGDAWIAGGKGSIGTELLNTATLTSTVTAPLNTVRGYHSTALLLPDARVVVAGDNNSALRKTAVIWSPPYLSQGPRPTLSTSGNTSNLAHGATLTLTSPDAISRVTMIKVSATSHGFNPDQKHHELPFAKAGTTITAQLPSNPNVAPPGWYYVFALRNGVPSRAVWARLRGVV